jgi:PAS domain S-box-containing protein
LCGSDTHNRLTFVNETYCKTFGKNEDELLGYPFTPLVHPDDITETLAAMEKLKHPASQSLHGTKSPYGKRMEVAGMGRQRHSGYKWKYY